MGKGQVFVAIAAAAMVCFAAGAAQAQSAGQTAMIEKKFAAADKDGDGKLTPEEAKAGMPRVSANFTKIDKGSKGFVTIEDIMDAMSSMGK